jgi:translation initiation factor IF-3
VVGGKIYLNLTRPLAAIRLTRTRKYSKLTVLVKSLYRRRNTISTDDLRINEEIRAPEVRLVDENGAALGIVSIAEALKIADERGLDLIEVSPQSVPPVCRMLLWDHFRYEQDRQERKNRQHAKPLETKEIRLGVSISGGDLETKIRQAKGFLAEGHRVRISVRFKGRADAHPELGQTLIDRFVCALDDEATLDRPATLENKTLAVVVSPKK